MFRIIKRAPWIALGGAAVWFFDPERGPKRRAEAKQWFDGQTNRPQTMTDEISSHSTAGEYTPSVSSAAG
jgi:hypothetical protein